MGWRAAKSVSLSLESKIAYACAEKYLNMDYLACNLPAETAKVLQDYWTEHWDGSPEARLAHEVCAFEHMVASNEDKITSETSTQPAISSLELQRWMRLMEFLPERNAIHPEHSRFRIVLLEQS